MWMVRLSHLSSFVLLVLLECCQCIGVWWLSLCDQKNSTNTGYSPLLRYDQDVSVFFLLLRSECTLFGFKVIELPPLGFQAINPTNFLCVCFFLFLLPASTLTYAKKMFYSICFHSWGKFAIERQRPMLLYRICCLFYIYFVFVFLVGDRRRTVKFKLVSIVRLFTINQKINKNTASFYFNNKLRLLIFEHRAHCWSFFSIVNIFHHYTIGRNGYVFSPSYTPLSRALRFDALQKNELNASSI